MIKLLFFLLTLNTQADLIPSIGVGKKIMDKPSVPFERFSSIGYQFNFINGSFIRPEAGYFLDISGVGKSSFYGNTLFGVTALSAFGPELHVAVGPSYLDNPDNILGGHFQFSLEASGGITDKNYYIGMAWKHLSSAGLNMPNQGRDFIVLQIRFLNL